MQIRNLFKNLFYSFKKVYQFDKTYLLISLLITICNSIYYFTGSYAIKIALSAIEEGKPFNDFVIELVIYSFITVILILIPRYFNQIKWYKNYRLNTLLSQEMSLKSLEIDYEVLERPETQDEMEKVRRASGEWNGVLGLINYFFNILSNLFSFLIACAIALSVNPLLIIILVVLAILKMVFENIHKKKQKKEFYDKNPPIWRKISYVNNIATNFSIGKDVRVYNMDEFIEEERQKATKDFLKLLKKDNDRTNFFHNVISFLRIFDTIFLYIFLVYEVIENNMTIATFTFLVSSIRNLTNSLAGIINQNSWFLMCNAQTDDYRMFMEKNYIIEKETETMEEKEVQIEFKDVYYSYYKQDGYALEGVSFKINKGEKIALVGYNGAGKTTLIKLISGFYHPTKGQILINGKDIDTLKREEIDKLISPSYQESLNLAYSIGENIAMEKKEDINYDKLNEALRIVELDKKVDSFPNKLDTILTRNFDDNGIQLSGGETQKLAIARAIYKNAPLFIFDEPTSAMDALSENNLYKNFKEITKNNTTIYISHRLSSAKFCDKIILLEKGKITEIGTHDELMKMDGQYKKLFATQAEYYKGGDDNE